MKFAILLLSLSISSTLLSQTSFEQSYDLIVSMLEDETEVNFTKAVFAVENAWHGDSLDYNSFQTSIDSIAQICKDIVNKNKFNSYRTAHNWAIFTFMTQPIKENDSLTYSYDFEDFLGEKKYSNIFVSRTLEDKKGVTDDF